MLRDRWPRPGSRSATTSCSSWPGLQAIPKAVIEAAAIDGAGPGRRFWRIVFPLLSPTTFFLLVVNIVYAFFDTFGIIHAVTWGGPAKATETLVYKVFNDGFIGLDFGGSAAQSVDPDGDRHRAHRRPVPLHRAAGGLLMVERRPVWTFATHAVLGLGLLVVAFPLYVTLVASTHTRPGAARPGAALVRDPPRRELHAGADRGRARARAARRCCGCCVNSLVMALAIAIGKIAISILSAYAIVYFRFPFRMACFWTIFLTLMLPVEVRIMPTFKVVADLGLLNSYAGLTIPLIASATATFLFRQFFLTVPEELTEAARIDGAGPAPVLLVDPGAAVADEHRRALRDPVHLRLEPVPVAPPGHDATRRCRRSSWASSAMVPTGDAAAEWNLVMATVVLAMLPPVAIVVLMQRWFIKGLIETEK